MKKEFLFCALVMSCIFSCDSRKEEVEINFLTTPAEKNSQLPNLFTSEAGDIYLSWVETTEEESQLYYSQLIGQEWSKATQISKGDNWFVNWADFPSMIVGENSMAAHWLQKSAQGTYDYDIKISTSVQGEGWSPAFTPHQDGIQAEHGFVSMLPMKDDHIFATWLDGRNTKTAQHEGSEMQHSGAMTLRAGIFDPKGQTISAWELDDMTCDCCQTSAVMSDEGPIVVYRDRSTQEIRDIFLTKYNGNEWSKPIPVANDFWEIAGCPVNGPDLAISEEKLAVVWYTASGNTPKVQLAISEDLGNSFLPPKTLSEGNTLGRVGISPYPNGRFVVTWMERTASHANIFIAIINEDGTIQERVKLAETSMERASGFPQVTTQDSRIIVAWTEYEKQPRVQTASFSF